MNYRTLHPWNLTPEEAIAQQMRLRHMVSLEDDLPGEITTIAGIDMSVDVPNNQGHAVVVVLSYPAFEIIEARYATAPLLMPYIPGLLSFREIPVILEAITQVQTIPDIIMVDGQGIAHPRGLGIAAHLGLLLDMPTIGVGKSKLYGKYDPTEVPDEPGVATPLTDRSGKSVIGTVMRTKRRTNPLFISPGNKMSVESATRVVLDSLRGYRLPEPTRTAHNLITAYKKTVQSR